MIHVVLCDDNPIILQKYVEQVEKIVENAQLDVQVHTYASGEQVVQAYQDNPNTMDILFLDILMGQMNGIETAKKLRELGCDAQLVYLTSSEEYVFDSFDTNPLQYIIKTATSNEKFEEVFMEAISKVESKNSELFVANEKEIPLEEIYSLESNGSEVLVHTSTETCTAKFSISEIAEALEEKGFAQANNSTVINLKYVDHVDKKEVVLSNGKAISLDESAGDFKDIFSRYLTETL